MAALLDIRVLTAIAVAVGVLGVLAVARPALVLPGAIALGVLLTRPSAVGERFPVVGPLLVTAAAGICLLRALRDRSVDRGPFPWPFLLLALAWVWLALHAWLTPGSEPNLGTSTITVFVPVMAFYLVVRDPELLARVRTALVGLVVGLSALVVVALLVIAVVGPTATLVGSVPLGYLGNDAGVYFPGALSYGLDPAAAFPRMLTVGREPGMGALVLGWAFFAMPADFPRPRLAQAILVLAILGTQSTAGVGILGVCIVLRAVLGRARFSPWAATVAVVGGAATVWLAVFSSDFGLLAKIDAGGSYDARNTVTVEGLRQLVTHPFTAYTTADLSSTNLVAAIAVDGAPWALLMLALLAAPVMRARRRDPLRYGSLFVVLIMLTSQPLAGNAGILLLAVIAFYAADRTPAPTTPAPPGPPSPSGPPAGPPSDDRSERGVRSFYAPEVPVRGSVPAPARAGRAS